jgi:putative membrane protein insertion efficiency factor
MRRAVAGLLTLYKRLISPLLPPACRFSPTCSEFARLAVLEHGTVRGGLLALRRLARCQPLGAGGIDLP